MAIAARPATRARKSTVTACEEGDGGDGGETADMGGDCIDGRAPTGSWGEPGRAAECARQEPLSMSRSRPITLDVLRRYAVARTLFPPTTLQKAIDRLISQLSR